MRRFDRLLLWTLVPLWALVLLLSVLSIDRNEVVSPIRVQGASGPSELPIVTSLPAWSIPAENGPSVQPGDRLLRVGDVDVMGDGAARVIALSWAEMDASGVVPLEVVRGGERMAASGRIPATIAKWPPLLMSLIYGGLAILGLLRFPTLRVAQLAFPTFMATAIWMGSLFGNTPAELLSSFFVRAGALCFVWPLNIRLARFMPEGRDGAPWARGWPWLMGGLGLLLVDSTITGRLAPPVLDLTEKFITLGGGLLVLFIGGLNYRRANRSGRRRFKWLLLGITIGTAPGAAVAFASAIAPALGQYFLASQLAQVAIPICLMIAIARHQLFDIDRVLNGAIVLVGTSLLLIGVGAAIGPPLVERAADATGATSQTVAVGLGVVALALVAPPALFVRGRLDAWVLAERRRREGAVEVLLGEISRARKLAELGELLRERLPEVWNARGCAVYLEVEGRLRRIADGLAAPMRFEDEAALLGALLRRGATRGDELGWSDYADFLFVSLARGTRPLDGFVVLGPERSGETYDDRDRALLTLVAERSAAALSALEDRELLAEAREMGRRLESARAEAERGSEAKSRMLATASHDARQPLQAMRLFLGTLASRLDDSELLDLVENAQLSATAMQQQFESLLDQSRLEAGELEVRSEAIDLEDLFAELSAFLGPLATARSLSLRFDSGGLFVRSDATLLRSILQNLIGNAIRYTREGGVRVSAQRVVEGVEIAVADTGVGIPTAERQRVFEAWRRGDDARAEGAGLGLSIVARLAERLGLDLALSSELGRGATFTLRLPNAERPLRSRRAPGSSEGLDGARVFVVDDDPSARSALEGALQRFGLTVRAVGSAEALIASESEPPDAVLLDFSLEEGTGLDALDALEARFGRLPAAVLSGEEGSVAADAARKKGIPFLRKPVAPVQLRAIVQSLVANGR